MLLAYSFGPKILQLGNGTVLYQFGEITSESRDVVGVCPKISPYFYFPTQNFPPGFKSRTRLILDLIKSSEAKNSHRFLVENIRPFLIG